MTHTPTPYSSDGPHKGLYIGGHHHSYWTIHSGDTGVCVLILPDADNTLKQRGERTATAAFIVRACNSHAANEAKIKALVEAAEGALRQLEDLVSECGDDEGGVEAAYGLTVTADALRLAIRSAKGK